MACKHIIPQICEIFNNIRNSAGLSRALVVLWCCNPIGASVGKLMYRKESNMNTEELYKQYTQLLRLAPCRARRANEADPTVAGTQ